MTKRSKEDETLSEPLRVDPTYVKELEQKLKALEEQTRVAQPKQTVLSYEGAGPSSERTPTRPAASAAPLEDCVEEVFFILMWSRVFS
jgi:hypothetical protein